MGRPATKPDLIEAANARFQKMWELIDSMEENERDALFDFGDDFKGKEAHWARDQNLRDVLVHVYEWHQLLLLWVSANLNGEKKPFLPEPYNWKTYGQMNVGFWEKHQQTPYDQAKTMLMKSHSEVMALIESLSGDELFAKRQFSWSGASTVGSYCVSATSSHYDWAMKKIKQHRKAWRKSHSAK